jgi:hypothetical protein
MRYTLMLICTLVLAQPVAASPGGPPPPAVVLESDDPVACDAIGIAVMPPEYPERSISPQERMSLQGQVPIERARACGQNVTLETFCRPGIEGYLLLCWVHIALADGKLWIGESFNLRIDRPEGWRPGIRSHFRDARGNKLVVEAGTPQTVELWIFSDRTGNAQHYPMQLAFTDHTTGEQLSIIIVEAMPE